MRRKPRLDGSHGLIVEALERAGARVQSFAAMGSGVPDIYAHKAGHHYWIECKPPGPPSTQKLRDSQAGWAEKMGLTVYVVSTPEQALDILTKQG